MLCELLHYISKYPLLADTHACSRLRNSLTVLSMLFSGKADQISRSASSNSEIVCLRLQHVTRLSPKPGTVIQYTVFQLIANNMSGCFFETRCRLTGELGTTHLWS